MKIGIDFDHVLFDTEKFKEQLFEKFPEFDSTYSQAEDNRGLYSVSKHAQVMDVPVSELMDAVDCASSCLYSDVDRLESVEHELIIVSRGDLEFQAEKIRSSGVLEYVESYVVVEEGPKDEAADIDALVDDVEDELSRTSLPDSRRLHFTRPSNTVDDIVEFARGLEDGS